MSTTEQLALHIDHDTDVRAAFDDGRLFLFVDDEKKLDRNHGTFRGCNQWKVGEPIRLVHAISNPVGGEIRGYVIVRGALYERGPHFMDWPEMDAEVSRQLGLPIGAVL